MMRPTNQRFQRTPKELGQAATLPLARRRDWFRQAQPKCQKCAIIDKELSSTTRVPRDAVRSSKQPIPQEQERVLVAACPTGMLRECRLG
jgi:hypothetical protein